VLGARTAVRHFRENILVSFFGRVPAVVGMGFPRLGERAGRVSEARGSVVVHTRMDSQFMCVVLIACCAMNFATWILVYLVSDGLLGAH
jgi:hypothetical protein